LLAEQVELETHHQPLLHKETAVDHHLLELQLHLFAPDQVEVEPVERELLLLLELAVMEALETMRSQLGQLLHLLEQADFMPVVVEALSLSAELRVQVQTAVETELTLLLVETEL
jgi:hypothetical protein